MNIHKNVMKKNGDNFDVYFFDYGNYATLTPDQIRVLPIGDADVRRFAFSAQFDAATTSILEAKAAKILEEFDLTVRLFFQNSFFT